MGKLAALSSSLLARKGQARPAMRPQGFAGYTTPVDDLGWNDMGHDVAGGDMPPVLVQRAALVAEIAPLPDVVALVQPADVPVEIEPELTPEPVAAPQPVPVPIVVRPVSVATATRIRRETSTGTKKGAKAAFTLRLDAERHLRLRLASAIADRSAQMLMTQALDAFLQTMPEVDALVAQLPAAKRR
jgi:hypothetical protein